MTSKLFGNINWAKDLVFDLLFSKKCMGCGKEGRYLCEKCIEFASETALICPTCHRSNFTGDCHQNCPAKYGLQGLASILEYDGVVKELIGQIKYVGITRAVSEFVEKAFEVMARDSLRFDPFLSFLLSDDTYITYVPMHKRKEKRRGFNQAKLIAEEISRIAEKKAISLLEKTKDTPRQTNLDREGRLFNVRGSFVVSGKLDIGKVVLVDDVWTTGATMKECCKVLRKAGVKNIWGFILVRTP